MLSLPGGSQHASRRARPFLSLGLSARAAFPRQAGEGQGGRGLHGTTVTAVTGRNPTRWRAGMLMARLMLPRGGPAGRLAARRARVAAPHHSGRARAAAGATPGMPAGGSGSEDAAGEAAGEAAGGAAAGRSTRLGASAPRQDASAPRPDLPQPPPLRLPPVSWNKVLSTALAYLSVQVCTIPARALPHFPRRARAQEPHRAHRSARASCTSDAGRSTQRTASCTSDPLLPVTG